MHKARTVLPFSLLKPFICRDSYFQFCPSYLTLKRERLCTYWLFLSQMICCHHQGMQTSAESNLLNKDKLKQHLKEVTTSSIDVLMNKAVHKDTIITTDFWSLDIRLLFSGDVYLAFPGSFLSSSWQWLKLTRSNELKILVSRWNGRNCISFRLHKN